MAKAAREALAKYKAEHPEAEDTDIDIEPLLPAAPNPTGAPGPANAAVPFGGVGVVRLPHGVNPFDLAGAGAINPMNAGGRIRFEMGALGVPFGPNAVQMHAMAPQHPGLGAQPVDRALAIQQMRQADAQRIHDLAVRALAMREAREAREPTRIMPQRGRARAQQVPVPVPAPAPAPVPVQQRPVLKAPKRNPAPAPAPTRIPVPLAPIAGPSRRRRRNSESPPPEPRRRSAGHDANEPAPVAGPSRGDRRVVPAPPAAPVQRVVRPSRGQAAPAQGMVLIYLSTRLQLCMTHCSL